jgi:hypothetical protein
MYKPSLGAISNLEDLTSAVQSELNKISAVLQEHRVIVNMIAVEPAKPQELELVCADGTNWNPGHGRGLYIYLDGNWKKVTHGS